MILFNSVNPDLPAGIDNKSSEVIFINNQPFLMLGGNLLDYSLFPDALKNCVDEKMASNPKAIAILDFFKITDKDERRILWMRCNLSGFDNVADFNEDFTHINTEYVPCNQRGICMYEGMFCQGVDVLNGKLSIRELRIMALIRFGYLDKEIAEITCISIDTIKSHKRNIQRKLGVERKASISNEAAHRGII